MGNRPLHFVTLSGVPLHVSELKWPFHPSTSGADWHILHGRAELLGNEDGLHVEVAVGMTQTMKDALGSLDSQNDRQWPAGVCEVWQAAAGPCNQPLLQLCGEENPVPRAIRAGREGDAEAPHLLAERQDGQGSAGKCGTSV